METSTRSYFHQVFISLHLNQYLLHLNLYLLLFRLPSTLSPLNLKEKTNYSYLNLITSLRKETLDLLLHNKLLKLMASSNIQEISSLTKKLTSTNIYDATMSNPVIVHSSSSSNQSLQLWSSALIGKVYLDGFLKPFRAESEAFKFWSKWNLIQVKSLDTNIFVFGLITLRMP